MTRLIIIAGLVAFFVLVLLCARWLLARARARDLVFGLATSPGSWRLGRPRRRARRVVWWASFILGVVLVAAVLMMLGLPIPIVVAMTWVVGVLVSLVSDQLERRRTALLESQLADAIDVMTSSLRAGASLLSSLEAAVDGAPKPLRPLLEDVSGRIRLGEDPRQVISDLAERVPLEPFRLFGFALNVHWDVGGGIADTLSSGGQAIRDRIELLRRVRSHSAQAQASVIGILLIVYAVSLFTWLTYPDRIETFASTQFGVNALAVVLALQAIGLLWMSRLTRVRI